MWRDWLQRFGLWLARSGGWNERSIQVPLEARIQALLDKAAIRAQANEELQGQLAGLRSRMATTATVTAPVLARATELARDADTTLTGGEAKRHQVYARLIKDFPITPKRELALAIELALFHAPKEG